MPKDNENIRLPLLGPVEPAEPQRFAPEQMIRCEECLRANPPTRITCMYCSVPLPITESSARLRKPILRPLERHESGYNTILLPQADGLSAEAIDAAAELLKLKKQDLDGIFAEGRPLPIARTASREEAELISNTLQGLGFAVATLNDEGSVKRVKSMSLDDSILVINAGQSQGEVEAPWSNILLLVAGRLIERRVEVKETRSRRAENEIVDTSEFFSDEPVIDLYLSTHPETWRISAAGFDFSCLGAEKALITNENIDRLQRRLVTMATSARFDDSYNRLRSLLDLVWCPEQQTKSIGWRRERPGKLSFGTATINSNGSQFTRYSRLVYYANLHGLHQ